MKYMSIVLISLLFVACGDAEKVTFQSNEDTVIYENTECAFYEKIVKYQPFLSYRGYHEGLPVPKVAIAPAWKSEVAFYDCTCKHTDKTYYDMSETWICEWDFVLPID